jgi:uncharacterized protein (DUF4415 family)
MGVTTACEKNTEANDNYYQLAVQYGALAQWKATGPGWQTRMAETLDKAL